MTRPQQAGWHRNGVPKWTSNHTPPRVILENTAPCAGCGQRFFIEVLFVAETPQGDRDFCSPDCFQAFRKR